jgi:hypothetical protein
MQPMRAVRFGQSDSLSWLFVSIVGHTSPKGRLRRALSPRRNVGVTGHPAEDSAFFLLRRFDANLIPAAKRA